MFRNSSFRRSFPVMSWANPVRGWVGLRGDGSCGAWGCVPSWWSWATFFIWITSCLCGAHSIISSTRTRCSSNRCSAELASPPVKTRSSCLIFSGRTRSSCLIFSSSTSIASLSCKAFFAKAQYAFQSALPASQCLPSSTAPEAIQALPWLAFISDKDMKEKRIVPWLAILRFRHSRRLCI